MIHYWSYGYGPGIGLFGALLTVLFWVLVIWLIVALARRSHWGHGTMMPPGNRSALDILKERYAKGEINKEEFEQKKKDLMS